MAQSNEALNGKLAGALVQQQGATAPAKVTTQNLANYLDSYRLQFERALAGVMNGEKFVRMLLTEVRGSEKLVANTIRNPQTLLAAALEAAALGIDFSIPNEGFLVPYGAEIACITGYKGLMKLASQAAIEAGAPLSVLSADEICENDIYERGRGAEPFVRHNMPKFGAPRGAVIGYVAISKDCAGRINFVEMTTEEVKRHKGRFMKAQKGPFTYPENDDAYGRKTVLRLLINRYLNMSAKLSRATSMLNRIDQAAEKGTLLTFEVDETSTGETNGKEDSGSEGLRKEGNKDSQTERKLQEGA